MSDKPTAPRTQSFVAEIVSSYVKKNQIAPADIPALISIVYQSLLTAGKAAEPEPPRTPAVSIRQSVRPQPRCLSRLWLARSNVATAREARAWPDTGAVQSAMELEARLPAHRTSLRSAPIRARKADGVGARGKGTQTTRSEGSNGLNRSSIYG
jgi:hypothetical protein